MVEETTRSQQEWFQERRRETGIVGAKERAAGDAQGSAGEVAGAGQVAAVMQQMKQMQDIENQQLGALLQAQMAEQMQTMIAQQRIFQFEIREQIQQFGALLRRRWRNRCRHG